MKKTLLRTLPATVLAFALLAGCSPPPPEAEVPPVTEENATAEGESTESTELVKLNIGATAVPHAEILNIIKDDLLKEGIELTVTEFADYTLLNQALYDGDIDANFFQHEPYLNEYVESSGQELSVVTKVHIEPIGVYSSKYKSIDELPDNAVVGIPNDATNEGRALMLLEENGLIKLKEGVGLAATPSDIVENPKNLEFQPLDAAILPRTLVDTDISIINTNYALEAGLNPIEDALLIESKESPFANCLVTKTENKDDEAILKVAEALNSEEVKTFIEETYKGAIVPAF